MTNELVTIPTDKIEAMEALAKECNFIKIMDTKGLFAGQIAMASAVHQLAELIDDEMMAPIMSLQNSGLGFRTDKTPGGYPVAIVKEVMIEATMRGLRMVGNEVNIIGGKFYAAKAGCYRLVMEWPGLTDFVLEQDVPKAMNGGALVGCKATWKVEGEPDSLEKREDQAIPVRVNSGQIVDATLGKAKRKMYAAVYDKLCGGKSPLPEGEVIDVAVKKPRRVTRSTLLPDPEEEKGPLQEQDYLEQIRATTDNVVLAELLTAAEDDRLIIPAALGRIKRAATKRSGELV